MKQQGIDGSLRQRFIQHYTCDDMIRNETAPCGNMGNYDFGFCISHKSQLPVRF